MNVVIASFAQDEVHDTRSGIRELRPGGLAYWINLCFESIKSSLAIHTAKTPAIVSISVSEGEETGVILHVPRIMPLSQNYRDASLFMVSTISDEYDLHDLEQTTGIHALDVQGYLRSNFFSRPDSEIDFVLKLFEIVKMTESEMGVIPVHIVNEFKKRICLVTKGSKGFSLFENGIETIFEATKINTQDTIGAGDTFFAAFCSEYIKSNNSIAAANFAKIQVELFLRNK